MIKMICPDCGGEQIIGETYYEWVPTGEMLCESCLEWRIHNMSVADYIEMTQAEMRECE